MQHGDIWRGIDLLAQRHGLSTSGLAKLAGLDATAFNKSKRLPRDGRPRWPSTESISRVLMAVGSDFDEFAALVTGRGGIAVPLVRQSDMDQADTLGLGSADETRLPGDEPDEAWFVLEIDTPDLVPFYHPGERLVIGHGVPLRAGDRVIVKPTHGDALTGTLVQATRDQIHVQTAGNPNEIRLFERAQTDLIARILWVSP